MAGVELVGTTWTNEMPESPRLVAQYRAHGETVEANLDGSRLLFDDPQEAVAPGQTVAFYDGDRVLGGALIADTFV